MKRCQGLPWAAPLSRPGAGGVDAVLVPAGAGTGSDAGRVRVGTLAPARRQMASTIFRSRAGSSRSPMRWWVRIFFAPNSRPHRSGDGAEPGASREATTAPATPESLPNA